MKAIRIGKDIHIKWALVINNGDTSLSDVDLDIEIIDSIGRKTAVRHTVTENEYVEFDFFGMFQKRLGEYKLTAWINKGKVGQAVVDECKAFKLVPCSHMEEGQDNNNVSVETLDITSAVALGVQGASAYEIWLRNGHEGTEEDFLNWLKADGGGSEKIALLQKEVEELQTKVNKMDGDDEEEETSEIDNLKEVQTFLEGYDKDDTLQSVIKKSQGTVDEEEEALIIG